MNTLSLHLPITPAKADKPVSPLASLFNQRSNMRLWAFCAAVRLSHQDKPIALKLLVELAIVIRTLTLLAQNARCATGKTVVAHRATRPVSHAGARRVKPVHRSAVVNVRQRLVAVAQRTLPTKVLAARIAGSRSAEATGAALLSHSARKGHQRNAACEVPNHRWLQ